MGQPMSEETKAKLRKAMTGKKHTEETLVKLRAAMTGKKLSEEAVAKMKESLKKTWDKKLGRNQPEVKAEPIKKRRTKKTA
jgi:hypothetical protein